MSTEIENAVNVFLPLLLESVYISFNPDSESNDKHLNSQILIS